MKALQIIIKSDKTKRINYSKKPKNYPKKMENIKIMPNKNPKNLCKYYDLSPEKWPSSLQIIMDNADY